MRKLTIVQLVLGIALLSNPVYSADMQDYAKIWKAWGKAGQNAYIWGLIDGGDHARRAIMSEITASEKRGDKVPKAFYENIRLQTATLYDETKIIDVITNLYKDPANSYVWFQDMVYIARDSLSGKDVTQTLLEARKAAIANYELNKKMERK
jgi:hypothetical protein